MKKTILFLLVTLLPAFVMAQKSSDDIYYVPPKKDHAAIKAAKDAENAQLYEQATKALEAQQFIIRTDRIEYEHGKYVNAPNYISVNNSDFYFHTFPFVINHNERNNPNQGTASKFKMKTDNKGNIIVSMHIDRIWFDDSKFEIKMKKGSNQCIANLKQVGNGRSFFIFGTIHPLELEAMK